MSTARNTDSQHKAYYYQYSYNLTQYPSQDRFRICLRDQFPDYAYGGADNYLPFHENELVELIETGADGYETIHYQFILKDKLMYRDDSFGEWSEWSEWNSQ